MSSKELKLEGRFNVVSQIAGAFFEELLLRQIIKETSRNLTIKEVAVLTGKHPKQVYQMCQSPNGLVRTTDERNARCITQVNLRDLGIID
jgi:hypothetical protein